MFCKFFFYLGLAMLCCALVGNSIGIMSGSLFKDAKKATALTPAFILPMMMLSGLYNKLGSIPIFIRWLQYLSPFRYGIHALLL
jgi:ABC-type multidrug transport system permease subunit